MTMPGRFITFEGLDGSGKSTQMRLAAEWLEQQGVDVLTTHEPGGTSLGGAVRELFLDSRWGQMDGVVELLLVSASRRQHVIEVIEPALGRGVPAERVEMAETLATGGLKPELTLLFDLPATIARKRGKSPKRAARGGVDRLDAEELEFYERVRNGFLARARHEPDRFRIVDSSGDKEQTSAAVREALRPLLATEPAAP